jgi:hypothetical protein
LKRGVGLKDLATSAKLIFIKMRPARSHWFKNFMELLTPVERVFLSTGRLLFKAEWLRASFGESGKGERWVSKRS